LKNCGRTEKKRDVGCKGKGLQSAKTEKNDELQRAEIAEELMSQLLE
jgi:hypothetical protein